MFKRNTPVCIALFFSLLFAAAHSGYCEDVQANNVLSLSIEKTVSIAFLNNKQIQIQEMDLAVARAEILGAQSEFLPDVNLNLGYKYNDAVLTSDIATMPTGSKDIGIFTGYKNENTAGISATEIIYKGGYNIADLHQSRLKLAVQEQTLRATKLDVEFDAKNLFYGLLLAYENERIMRELLIQAKAHSENVKNRYEQGTSSKFDLLQSRVHVSKIVPELVKAENSVELIKADLKKLLSISIRNPIELDGALTCSFIGIDEDAFLEKAYMYRPEMILRTLGVDVSKWSIEMARSGYRPNINAIGDYRYKSNDVTNMFNERHNVWAAGMSVSFLVFDGGSTQAKINEARARYAQSVLEKVDVAEWTAVDIRRACLDLIKAKAIIDSQRDHIVEAAEALRLSEIGYDNGVMRYFGDNAWRYVVSYSHQGEFPAAYRLDHRISYDLSWSRAFYFDHIRDTTGSRDVGFSILFSGKPSFRIHVPDRKYAADHTILYLFQPYAVLYRDPEGNFSKRCRDPHPLAADTDLADHGDVYFNCQYTEISKKGITPKELSFPWKRGSIKSCFYEIPASAGI